MVNFRIDIVSDTVCPWCYIGHKRLQSAISQFQASNPSVDHTFTVEWHAYYLNPNAPNPSVDKTAYYKTRFGETQSGMMFDRMHRIGAETGIKFSFGGKTGNTRDSHRIIQFGKEKGKQTEVVEKLFAAYFENEQDITDHEVLVKAATDAGLEEMEAREWLNSDKGGHVVDREVEEARRKGISGVPNFTINKSHVLGGAQDPSEFIDVFEFFATD
ncbi:DSBA-like thioredoxin domain-containing protein [Trichophaea hybrida]|nr:DSBA-like thioredoxin domain-containing protein [Trichophaea hybrida]